MRRSKAQRRRIERRKKLAWANNTQTSEIVEVVAHNKTMRFYDASGKVAACWKVGTMYEQPLLDHITNQAFEGVAVDIGANVGNHTIWFASVCELDVVAFEPIKHAELQKNVTLNELDDKITIECVALGKKSGLASHTGRGKLHTGKGPILVRTLDSYGLCNVVLIKADIEGMESHMLQGASETIVRCKPVIFAEQWSNKEYQDIASVLTPLGYTMTTTFNSRSSPTPVGRWDFVP